MTYGYIPSKDVWGCLDPVSGDTGIACFYNVDYSPAECYYNGIICGRRCQYDGTECREVYLPQCASEEHCPQTGYDMSDGCICDGSTTTQNGVSYCCPVGHTYTNGGCTLITCDTGQIADNNGICRDACENNTEVTSTCVCAGSTHTDKFNRTICCDANHTWDETTETCI